jgi:hypothetical protein
MKRIKQKHGNVKKMKSGKLEIKIETNTFYQSVGSAYLEKSLQPNYSERFVLRKSPIFWT